MSHRWPRVAAALGVTLAIVSGVAIAGWMRGSPPGVVRRFNITMDQYQTSFGNPVISPDGTHIVYSNFEGALMMRTSDELAAKLIPGSDGGWVPVYSPDSKTIAFNTGFPGAVKILPLDGGVSRTLVADSTYGTGLAWSTDGWIYYFQGAGYGRDLMRIRATGGTAEFIARPDSAANALFFFWPQVLPNGRKVILTVYPATGDPYIAAVDVGSGKVTTIATGVMARYASTGHIIVVQGDGTVVAARFDAAKGTVLGAFTTVATGLYVGPATSGSLSISDDGTFVYAGFAEGTRVVQVSRDNGRETVVDPTWHGEFGTLSLSRDGSQLAIVVTRGGRYELWVRSLRTGAMTKVSSGGTQSYRPSWSPDGRRVVFTSDLGGIIATWQVPADGSEPPTRLIPAITRTVDEAMYSPDGRWIVFRTGSGGGRDIHAMRPGVDSSMHPLVDSKAEEFSPTVSPDGRWLAYASDETGRTEVYVRPFPDTRTARYTVSHNGGSEPLWSHSGRHLFFRDAADNLVEAAVDAGSAFHVASERGLFSTHGYINDNRHHSYTIAPDDRSFYFVKSLNSGGTADQLIVTLNWFEELKRKVGK